MYLNENSYFEPGTVQKDLELGTPKKEEEEQEIYYQENPMMNKDEDSLQDFGETQ